jgi:hypothetical protein
MFQIKYVTINFAYVLWRVSILITMKTSSLTFMSYWFKNENRYVDFRIKSQITNLVEIDYVVSEMEHADKHAAPMQQTTHEIYISRGMCPSGTLLMVMVKCNGL